MSEFKTSNAKRGVERVQRTATGYRMFVYNAGNPSTHLLEEDGVELILGRGVEDGGNEDMGSPFIEIDFSDMKHKEAASVLNGLFTEAFEKKGLKVGQAKSTHGEDHVCFHVIHNSMTDIFNALLLVMLPNGQPLIPDAGREFVLEQQQVRHGLEQSLLNAFGQDMYAIPRPSKRNMNKGGSSIPKSEINRIARLVDYFRNGVPEMRKHLPV